MKAWICRLGIFVSALFLMSGHSYSQNYRYGDGSANQYDISPGKLEYLPVKKENSSSGSYSGGTAKVVKLSDADFRELSALLDEGIATKSSHTENRVMMSGVIRRNINNEKSTVILKPGAAVKQRIESKLLELVGRRE